MSSLQKALKLCDDLISEIEKNRSWITARLDICSCPVIGAEEIVLGGPDCPLTAFRSLLAEAIESEPDYSGREALYFRRRFWIWLTLIYEEATSRRAAVSKDKDGAVTGNFVRYILTVSAALKSLSSTTPDMVDQFVDWYRSSASEQDRDEVYEYRSMATVIGDIR
ncbi:hypothetical protein [Methylobacterium isbiliense]|uniref:hypothetical protein n=1 Tax=Methylobacterium isbiliense TaxID=315478 RepID=UPI001EDFCE25|nr:hypothetical protein [Methylobacterium isbiliense]MDN3625598.1 hypothetical protein [Methylobacterium isbiliense]